MIEKKVYKLSKFGKNKKKKEIDLKGPRKKKLVFFKIYTINLARK